MINKKWRPELFQGRRAKAPYFEGWYFKQIDTKGRMIAFIPGMQKEAGKDSSFIQLIYDNPPKSKYFWYPYDAFSCASESLHVDIDGSKFSESGIFLDIKNSNNKNFSGELTFTDLVRVKSRLFSPGIMGWYQLVPGMECLHGLVSANHLVNGHLNIDGEEWLFENSAGYIEKDWGRSFPESWIWTQSNSFHGNLETSAMLSVARIPWMGKFFTGFLGVIYHEGSLYRFATYTGHKITNLKFSDTGVELSIRGRKTSIEFKLEKGSSAVLKAPAEGRMIRDIEESSAGRLYFRMTFADGRKAVEAEGFPAGAEIVGDTDILLKGLK